jgi:hypothetical protein
LAGERVKTHIKMAGATATEQPESEKSKLATFVGILYK